MLFTLYSFDIFDNYWNHENQVRGSITEVMQHFFFYLLSILSIFPIFSVDVSPYKSTWISALNAPQLSFRKLHMLRNSIPINDSFYDWWIEKKNLGDHIRNTCLKFGSSVEFPISKSELLYDQRNNLSYCLNAKVVYFISSYKISFVGPSEVSATSRATYVGH